MARRRRGAGEPGVPRGAFDPAKEKFNSVLENNPKDIRAIRGLILATARVHSTEDMRDRYDNSCSDLDAIKNIVASANNIVTEEERNYLGNLVCLFEMHKIYNFTEKRKKETMDLERKRDLQLEVKDERGGILGQVLTVLLYVMLFLLAMTGLIFSSDSINRGYFYFIILPLMIIIIAGFIFLCIKLRVKVVKIPESSNSLSDKLEIYEKKYSEIFSEVMEFESSFIKEKETTDKKVSETVPTQIIICAKCGGLLKLNNTQELYECNSCGVSYGKSLFFGDLTANAVKAMNMGEFAEADQILSHKLKTNPKDFEALLGRFLCAGKWKSLAGIDLEDRLFMSHVRKLPDQQDM